MREAQVRGPTRPRAVDPAPFVFMGPGFRLTANPGMGTRTPHGRAVARALASEGWRVVCAARSQKALETLDDEIKAEAKGAAVLAPLDLKDFDAIDRLGAALHERFGKLDALAHCAGAIGALTP